MPARGWTRPASSARILDRDAGGFRLGPADMHGARPPAATCRARWCWRRAGARRPAGSSSATCCYRARGTTRTSCPRPTGGRPTDYDADHVLLRTVRCVNGEVQVVLDCEPVFDYGRRPASWAYTDRGYHQGVATRRRASTSSCTLTTDMRIGFEGGRATARTLLKEGEQPLLRAVVERARRRRRPTTRPTTGWCGPRTTGSTGWPGATSPTTPGAATSSAARSPSRA